MVQLLLRISARPNAVPGMIQALSVVMFQAKLERGCQFGQLYAETGDSQSFCYVEEWATAEDLQRQILTPRFSSLLSIMETARQAPVLEVNFVSNTRGLDYVQEVRTASDETHSSSECQR